MKKSYFFFKILTTNIVREVFYGERIVEKKFQIVLNNINWQDMATHVLPLI